MLICKDCKVELTNNMGGIGCTPCNRVINLYGEVLGQNTTDSILSINEIEL